MKSATKRVVIISGQSLFGRGIESLLVQDRGIEIIGTRAEIKDGVDLINRHHPDVVIINCENPDLDYSHAIACMLKARLGTCLVCLDLENNQIYVYRGELKEVQRVEDLLKVIQD